MNYNSLVLLFSFILTISIIPIHSVLATPAITARACDPGTRECPPSGDSGSPRPPTPMPLSISRCEHPPFLEEGSNPSVIIDPTAPHWSPVVDDRPVAAEGVVRYSRVAPNDDPTKHRSHDWNFFVKLDPQYNSLNGQRNEEINGEMIMEMEWETAFFPKEFLPFPGDKVWMMGRWVWDCGHLPYKTEIHPPEAVAFTRTEPVFFSIGNIKDNLPSIASKTYIYVHGKGGYYDTAVGGKDYEFDVTLPPRPSDDAELFVEVLQLPYGGPAPIISPISTGNPPTKVHVVYPLGDIAPSSDNKFGAIIAAGWREPILTKGYKEFIVSFDSITIADDHEPLEGEWKLAAGVNGKWIDLLGSDLSNVWSYHVVDRGRTINFDTSKRVSVIVPEDGSQLTIQTTGWESDGIDELFGRGGVLDLRQLDFNDPIGVISDNGYTGKRYVAPDFGVGEHGDISIMDKLLEGGDDRAATSGDYRLRYTVWERSSYSAGTPNPKPQQVTTTFLNAKLIRSDGSEQPTQVLFNFGTNKFYPETNPTEGININYGSTINFPPNFSITGLAIGPAATSGIEVRVADSGLHPPRVPRGGEDTPEGPGLFGENPLILELSRQYSSADNFGEGVHTERSEDFPAGPSIFRGLSAHFEITYRIDVRDYNPFVD